MFRDGTIDGVIFTPVRKFMDRRGWLVELFREDQIDERYFPVMAYVSMTLPGVVRGPHEHRDQADLFGFIGPSNFKLYLWDNRSPSPTRLTRHAVIVGADNPHTVIIPPGVVHAYENVGSEPGIVYNAPNRLYAGRGRTEPVDEIRHEEEHGSIFSLNW